MCSNYTTFLNFPPSCIQNSIEVVILTHTPIGNISCSDYFAFPCVEMISISQEMYIFHTISLPSSRPIHSVFLLNSLLGCIITSLSTCPNLTSDFSSHPNLFHEQPFTVSFDSNSILLTTLSENLGVPL